LHWRRTVDEESGYNWNWRQTIVIEIRLAAQKKVTMTTMAAVGLAPGRGRDRFDGETRWWRR